MQVQSLVTHCFVRKYKDAYFCKLAVNKKFFVKYGNDNTEEMHVITDPIDYIALTLSTEIQN